MKATIERTLLILAVLILTVSLGRGVWVYNAMQTQRAIETTMHDKNITLPELIDQIRAEMYKTKVLASTCMPVFECTLETHRNAVELTTLHQRRLEAFIRYQEIKQKSIMAYRDAILAGGRDEAKNQAFLSWKEPFITAKAVADDLARQTKLASEKSLPQDMVPIFQSLQ